MSKINLISREAMAEICPKLTQLRLEHQLSLEELQTKVNIKIRSLKRIENNKGLAYSHLRRLLDFYGKKIRITLEDK